jgi:hypothetical protein
MAIDTRAAAATALTLAYPGQFDFNTSRIVDPRNGTGFGFGALSNATDDYTKKVSGAKNLIFKPIYHIIDWYKFSNPDISPQLTNVRNLSKDVKNALGLVEIPGKLNEIRVSVGALAGEFSVTNLWQVFLKGVDLVSPVCDVTEVYSSKVDPIAPETMKKVGTVNSVALLISMGNSYVKDGYRLSTEVSVLYSEGATDDNRIYQRIGSTLINLSKAVSYIALGLIALAATFTGITEIAGMTVATAILICSTSALTFTLLGEYYKSIVGDPYAAEANLRFRTVQA